MPDKIIARLGILGDEKQVEIELPEGKPSPWDLDSDLRVAGTSVPRLDGPAKSTGTARYTFDIQLDGMLFGKTLRSPHAAARVGEVNVDGALAVPGVKAAYSVAPRQVRYVGEEIAVVAAETEAAAEEALARIKVQYEVLPFVIAADAARADGAPQVFDQRENAKDSKPTEQGDVDEAIASAAAVIRADYTTQSQLHDCLESHGTVARWEEDGSLTVWTSTQATFGVRDGICRALDLPIAKVRVLCEHMGGGFGAKFGPGPFTLHAVELAKRTGKPVKMMLDRREELLVGGSRPDSFQKVIFAADAEGKLTGAWVTSYGTGGIGGGAGLQNPAIYDFGGNIRKTHTDVFTNRAASCAFRAPGHPQGIFAVESAIDELADKLGMDPLEFRRKNDSNPVRRKEYELGAAAIGWKNRQPFKALDPKGSPIVRGYGMASSLWYNTGGPGHKVAVEVFRDGHVVVRNGAQDIGTGTRTMLAICVAEDLGIDPRSITVQLGDTRDPPGPASGGSATAPGLAPVARDAGWLAAQELFQIAAKELGVAAKDLEASGGRIHKRGEAGKGMSWHEACAQMAGDSIQILASRDNNYAGYLDQCAGVQFAEVEVDTETGVVAVKKIVAVQDAGMVIDRLTFDSQVIGGVIQGISFALFEDRILDPTTGNLVNPDMLNYKIAGAMDMPEIQVIPLDVANGKNSTSTMGVGEPPMIPTPGAIANAVANACGARVRSLPITPWRVLEALGKV